MNKSIPDIVRDMRGNIDDPYLNSTGLIGARRLANGWSASIEAAWKAEAAEIVQIIQDAIASYESAYPEAPNDDAEFYIKHQIDVANDWLAAHGFARVNVKLDKEEEPW